MSVGSWRWGAFVLAWWIGAVEALGGTHQDDERGDRLLEAVERNPRPGTAFDLWVRHLVEHGRLEEEMTTRRAKAEHSTSATDALILGNLLARSGDENAADRAYARACELDPERSLAFQLHGFHLARNRELDRAVVGLQRALDLEPTYVDRTAILLGLGRFQMRLGRDEAALEAWNELLEAEPNDRHLREELADLLAQEGRHREAIVRWREARALEPENPFVQYSCGIEIARLLEKTGDVETARAELTAILDRLDGDSWQAESVRDELVDSYLRRRDHEGLVEFFQSLFDRRPDDVSARLAYIDALQRTGKDDDALRELRAAISFAPGHLDLREKLVVHHVRARQWDEAIAACESWGMALPDDPDPHQVLGELYLRKAGWRRTAADDLRAIEAWSKIAEHDPTDARLALQVAALCYQTAEGRRRRALRRSLIVPDRPQPMVEAAERFYRRALACDEQFIEAYDGYAQFLAACGRSDEAFAQWQEMVAPPRDLPENFERLAGVLLTHDRIEEAVTALEHAIALSPEPARLLDKLIRLIADGDSLQIDSRFLGHLAQLEELAENPVELERALRHRVDAEIKAGTAIATRDRLARSTTKDSSARDWWLLGMLQLDGDQAVAAMTSLQVAQEKDRTNTRLAFSIGEAFERSGALDEAARQYRQVAADHPASAPRCLERIALLELARERYDAAATAADQLLAKAPGNLDYALLAADVHQRAGDHDRAVEVLYEAVQTAPRNVGIRTTLAHVLVELQRADEALEHYWQALLDSDDVTERRALSQTLGQVADKHKQATRYSHRLREHAERGSEEEGFDLCLADYLVASDQLDAALDHLAMLHEREPDNAAVLDHLVERAAEGQAWDRAAQFQEKLVDLDATADRLEGLARFQSSAGDREEARDTWMWLLEEFPERVKSLFQEMRSAMASDQFDVALDLVVAGTSVAPADPNLRLWAGMLALDQQEHSLAIEHFGVLLDELDPNAIDKTLGSRRFGGFFAGEDAPMLPLRPAIDPGALAGWFEDGHLDRLMTLDSSVLIYLVQNNPTGSFNLKVDRRNARLLVEFQSESGSGTYSTRGDEGPSFEIKVEAATVQRALAAVQQRDGASTSPATTSRLRALGYLGSASQPQTSASSPRMTSSVSSWSPTSVPPTVVASAEIPFDQDGVFFSPPAPVQWPRVSMFDRLETVSEHLALFSVFNLEHLRQFPGNFRQSLYELVAEQRGRFRLTALIGLQYAAQKEEIGTDWLRETKDRFADKPDLLADLACVAYLGGQIEGAIEVALDIDPAHEPLAAALSLLQLTKQADLRQVADDQLERALEAFETLVELLEAPEFHSELSLVSHLVTGGRMREAAEVVRQRVAPEDGLPVLLEFAPWVARIEDDSLQEEFFGSILEAIDAVEDADLRDGALVTFARLAPELYWFEAVDLILDKLRRESEGPPRAPVGEVTIRTDLEQSHRFGFGFPRPLGVMSARALAMLMILQNRAAQAELEQDLVAVVVEALEATPPNERRALEWAAVSLQWLSGDRDRALERLREIYQRDETDIDAALSLAAAEIEAGDVLASTKMLVVGRSMLEDDQRPWPSDEVRQAYANEFDRVGGGADERLLLGSPADVLEGLIARLRFANEGELLEAYFPSYAELQVALAAWIAQDRGQSIEQAWTGPRRIPHRLVDLMGVAKQEGHLDELRTAIDQALKRGASIHPLGVLGTLADLTANDVGSAKARYREWRNVSGPPYQAHPAFEDLFQKFLETDEFYDDGIQGLCSMLAAHLEGGPDDTNVLNQLIYTLFEALLDCEDEAERRRWVQAARSGLPKERVAGLVAFVGEDIRRSHDTRARKLLVPAIDWLMPYWTLDARVTLQDWLPEMVARFLDELEMPERRRLLELCEEILFVHGLDKVPQLHAQFTLVDRTRTYPVLSVVVQIADSIGELDALDARYRAHPRADGIPLSICRMAVAVAREDIEEMWRLQASIEERSGLNPMFPRLGEGMGTLYEEFVEELEIAVVGAEEQAEKVALSMQLAACLTHLERGGAARRYIDLAFKLDPALAVEKAWPYLIPDEESIQPRGFPDLIDRATMHTQDADLLLVSAVAKVLLGKHHDALSFAQQAAFRRPGGNPSPGDLCVMAVAVLGVAPNNPAMDVEDLQRQIGNQQMTAAEKKLYDWVRSVGER